MERQPNIEIFLHGCPMEQLLTWIEMIIGPLEKPEEAGDSTIYPGPIGPTIVTPVQDGFVSVCFNTSLTPWETDVDCARQAARELKCTVRCDPGQHFPEVHPASDIFLEINGETERLINLE